MLRLLFLSAGASVGALRFESVTPLVVKSGTTINLFGIELDDIITLNDEMENVLMPGFEINLNQTSNMVTNSLVCKNPRLEQIDESFPQQAALYSQSGIQESWPKTIGSLQR